MATNIPPHNPEEVCAAAIRLLDALLEGKQLSSRELCRTIKGPDFPTGGQIVSSPEEIKQIYETGQGSIKVRATWEPGNDGRDEQDDLHHEHPVRDRTSRCSSSASPRSCSRARCRCSST